MNIFALHPKPRKAARWHLDKHVCKMVLEYCQLLYTAHWVLHYPELLTTKSPKALSVAQKQCVVPSHMQTAPICETTKEPTYRPCHVHHPSAKWARETKGNYEWLCQLAEEVAREYRFRYHKTHSCEKHVMWLKENVPMNIPNEPRKGFSIAMADEYKVSNDPIRCYRHYYRTSKQDRGLIAYTSRHVPHWLTIENKKSEIKAQPAEAPKEPRLRIKRPTLGSW